MTLLTLLVGCASVSIAVGIDEPAPIDCADGDPGECAIAGDGRCLAEDPGADATLGYDADGCG